MLEPDDASSPPLLPTREDSEEKPMSTAKGPP